MPRIPRELREAASFPEVPDGPADAAAWARVLVVAAKQLASAARGADSWPHAVQSDVATAIDETKRLATAANAPVLAAQEARGTWRQAGVRSFEDHRARTTRAGRGAARREVAAARAVQELDGGLDALAAGTMTPVHAEQLGVIAGRLPAAQKTALLTGEGAQRVRRFAEQLDATRFAAKVEDLAATLSARQVEETHQDARRRRHLELSPTPDGMTRISGLLDPVAGHTLQVALDAASPRPAADDERTRGQRQADALHTLASTMLAEAKGPGHARPHVLITMTAETFEAARTHLEAATHAPGRGSSTSGASDTVGTAGTGADRAPATGTELGPAPAVRCQDGPLLPLSELGRTLCDSQIARLVVSADSEPLDLGRSQRLFTAAQRRAVIARDGGCAWEGCTTPARFGEVHHLDWWDDDHGHTDVSRGVLVCVFHHHELHRHDLDLVRVENHDPPGPDGPEAAGSSGGSPIAPDEHVHRRFRYVVEPRAKTRARREEARRARLLAEVRADSADRKAQRAARGDPALS